MITALAINVVAAALLIYSFRSDREVTFRALKVALMKGLSLAPWLVGIIVVIGIVLSFIPPAAIERYLGGEMTLQQVAAAALVGTASFIPNLISLPLAGSLVESGASYTTVAAFLTTLTMVGFVTFPLELKEFGKRITITRNLLAFLFAVLIALAIGVLM